MAKAKKPRESYRRGDFEVVIDWEQTLEGMAKINKETPLLRTGHSGNWFSASELPALCGAVTPVIHPLNKSGMDKLYHPDKIIVSGNKKRIAPFEQDDRLAPYLRFKDSEEGYVVGERYKGKEISQIHYDLRFFGDKHLYELIRTCGARTPAHLHYLSLKRLFPNVLVYTEVYLRNRETTNKALSVFKKTGQDIFDRYVDEAGQVYFLAEKDDRDYTFRSFVEKDSKDKAKEIKVSRKELSQRFWELVPAITKAFTEGEIPKIGGPLPNAKLVCAMDIIMAAMSGREEAYHSGASQMIRYVVGDEFAGSLADFWEHLVKEPYINVPKMKYRIVPVTPLLFLVHEKDRGLLSRFWDTYEAYAGAVKARGEMAALLKEAGKKPNTSPGFKGLLSAVQSLKEEFVKARAAFLDKYEYLPRKKDFDRYISPLSQYDVRSVDDMYFDPRVMKYTLRELNHMLP